MANALTKLTLNRKGMAALLKSAPLAADLKARADRIASAAGEGFEASSYTGRNRARASVITTTYDAMKAEAESAVLTRAIDAGR